MCVNLNCQTHFIVVETQKKIAKNTCNNIVKDLWKST